MNMDRVMLLAFTLMLVLVDSNAMDKKCLKLMSPGIMRCCKSGMMMPMATATRSRGGEDDDEENECMKMSRSACARDICFGKQMGYGTDDGNFDEAAVERLLLQVIKKATPVIEALKKNCINGDLERFGPPVLCKLVKLRRCFQRQAMNDCKEWKDVGPCAGVKELANECRSINSTGN